MYRHEKIAELISDNANASYKEIKALAKEKLGLKTLSHSTIAAAKKLLRSEGNTPTVDLRSVVEPLITHMRERGITCILVNDSGDLEITRHEIITVRV